jgi:hypothetical protein
MVVWMFFWSGHLTSDITERVGRRKEQRPGKVGLRWVARLNRAWGGVKARLLREADRERRLVN